MTDGATRRRVLAGAAAGLAAATAPVDARDTGEVTPQDPKTKYRSEPFPEQHQPWPALQSKMNPRPD